MIIPIIAGEFSDFNSLIHPDSSLSEVDKFQYFTLLEIKDADIVTMFAFFSEIVDIMVRLVYSKNVNLFITYNLKIQVFLIGSIVFEELFPALNIHPISPWPLAGISNYFSVVFDIF